VYKRGVVLGCVIGWGNLNGIVSSNIYFSAPKNTVGHAVTLGYMIVCLLGGSIVLELLLMRENQLRRKGKRNHRAQGLTEKEAERLGDMKSDFIYTI
jgi:hypothetical protein